MFDTGYMNFFEVEHCGLYKIGKNDTFGCELDETFQLISEWVDSRPLSQRIPWDPGSARRNKSKCYCKDIYKDEDTGDFLIVLWKSDTDSAGTLWGAPEDDDTGKGKVIKYTNEYKGNKVIWGRPCYYWVIPSLNTIVSIKFDHSVCDAQLFEDYVLGCLNNRVKHENRKKDYTEKGFVRISYVGGDKERYQFRFGMKLKSLNTSNAKLKDLASKVTHIIRRETIIVDSKDERAEWVKKFTDVVPFVSAKPKSKSRKIEVKAEAKPSPQMIKEIIEGNAKEGRKPSDWDNVGFATETGVTWVDKYRLRDTINVTDTGDSLLKAEELYDQIRKSRYRYIEPIQRSADLEEKNSIAVGE